MQARKSLFMPGWHIHALDALLIRHGIVLDGSSDIQMSHLLATIDRCNPSAFEWLEILRLFEKALHQRDTFIKMQPSLSNIDLFFASIPIGFKWHYDLISYTTNNVLVKLPQQSIYFREKKQAAKLERTFLICLNWELQGTEKDLKEAYTALLKPLPECVLNQFASECLVSACTDAGDHQQLHDILCQLSPDFKIKSALVAQVILPLPLLHAFSKDVTVRNNIVHDVTAFLNAHHTTFELHERTINNINSAISRHFESLARPIQDSEFQSLAFYFTAIGIQGIVIRHLHARVLRIQSHLTPINNVPFDRLGLKLKYNEIQPAWLSPLLDGLEKLVANNSLTPEIFSSIFDDYNHSHSILNAYLAINSEGWLEHISSTPSLEKMVSELVHDYHDSPETLMQGVDTTLRSYFSRVVPTLLGLARLHSKDQTERGKSLRNDLSRKYLVHFMTKQAKQLWVDPSPLTPLILNLVNYLKMNTDLNLPILYALNNIDYIIDTINPSFYLKLVDAPDELRFKAMLSMLLVNTLNRHDLRNVVKKVPHLCETLINRVKSDQATFQDIRAHLNRFMITGNDMQFSLNRALGLKIHIKCIIEGAIANGELHLDNNDQKKLAEFYKAFHMTDLNHDLQLPACHLFSPKPNPSEAVKHEDHRTPRKPHPDCQFQAIQTG